MMDFLRRTCILFAGKKGSASAGSGHVLSIGREDDEQQTPMPAPKKKSRKTAADLGSSKRGRKRTFIDLIQEVDKNACLSLGIVRDTLQFLDGSNRHLLVRSGLKDSANSLIALRKKPFWVRDCDAWVKNLVSSGMRTAPIVIDKKAVSATAFHLGFIYFPTHLRPHSTGAIPPVWNL